MIDVKKCNIIVNFQDGLGDNINLNLDDIPYDQLTYENLKSQLDVFVDFNYEMRLVQNQTISGDVVTKHFLANFKGATLTEPEKERPFDMSPVYIGAASFVIFLALAIIFSRGGKKVVEEDLNV